MPRLETLAALAIAACAGVAGPAAAQVTLTMSSWVPPSHLLTRAQSDWCGEVGKATEGRVECNLLPKPVVPAPGTFDAVRDGLADLDGVKFRVGGGVVNDVGKALGVNMTLEPAPESYELRSSGVVDGTWFPDESIVSFRLDEVVKYRTAVPGGLYNTRFALVMNPATWAKIPKADQAVVDRMSGEWAARFIGKYWDDMDTKSRAAQQVAGVQSITADAKFVADFKARTAPVEEVWIKEAEARGLKNARAVPQEFRAEIEKLR